MDKWNTKKPLGVEENSVNVLDRLDWTVQPPMGLIRGKYFREECDFAPHFPGDSGYHGILEVVQYNDKLVHVEFNEITSSSYYLRRYQNVSKRRSSYCFYQATKERTAHSLVVLNNGIVALEKQMIKENRLTGDFDLVSGASNSVKRAFLPLAKKINSLLMEGSSRYYYGIAKSLGDGVTARLEVVTYHGNIERVLYDEIFADDPAEITNEKWKKYYRQSKRFCLDYESSYPDGFNSIFDLLEKRVILTQDLLNVEGLPWSESNGTVKRNEEYDHYLDLAKQIVNVMQENS